MKICCIDFETANSARGSACSVGVAVLDGGNLCEVEEKLILPHASCRYFDPFNVSIHGIRREDVMQELEFDRLSPWLFTLLDADMVVAHNAAFDMSVLRGVCDLYRLRYPSFHYFCTCKAAGRMWDQLSDHKLNTVCDYIGHRFNHHNAAADAEAAGRVLLAMLQDAGTDSPFELATRLGIRPGELSATGYTPCSSKKIPAKKK